MLRLYNTLTKQEEAFEPLEAGRVKMYVCGPTVYGLLHIGNGRTFMFWDVARRYFEYLGLAVTYVQNFTDVDDKIIQRGAEEGVPAETIAQRYTEAYFKDMDGLGLHRATHYPKCTESIPGMVGHIEGLIAKGFAYAVNGDVYYRVRAFDGYGKLSGRKVDELQSGARVEVGEQKEDPLDFALWKAAKPGEPAWSSPWGEGRPGWHIECSAMVREVLGDTIDIHAGGMDLKFPHHENEIAQSEALTEKPFSRFWMHTGFLNMDAEKMSKSLGNIKTTREMVAAYGAQALRVFLLQTHYRQELDFSDGAIHSAHRGWQRLREKLVRIETEAANREFGVDALDLVRLVDEGLALGMNQDLNTAKVIANWFTLVSGMSKFDSDPRPAIARLRELSDQVLGLDLSAPSAEEIPDFVDSGLTEQLLAILVDLRNTAKSQKNWAMADDIRNRLKAAGVVLVDQKDGSTTWELAAGVPV